MPKKIKRRDFLKGYKVSIKQHVIDRYMERTGVGEKEARETIEVKFRNSKLTELNKGGYERRVEIKGSLNKRLIFVSKKCGHTFVVITCYLQGKRDNWWKNEGLIIEKPTFLEENEEQKEMITEEITAYFEEEATNNG